MAVSAVSSGTALTAADLNPKPAAATSDPSGAMGQTDFMKLLIAQMQNQNPLDPQNPSDFASQLAQFSSLQGMTQLNENFSNLLQLQGLSQGTNLIGKKVSYTVNESSPPASGVVQSVKIASGEVQLVVGGQSIPISQLVSIGA